MMPRLFLAVAGLSLLAFTTRADDALNAAARKIFATHQDSVVWITAVAKTSFSADGSRDAGLNMQDQESKMEALGTILDTNGLMVAALSQIDPGRAISGRQVRTQSGMVKIDATSSLKDVKVVMPDGTEIPAEVVMKDVDLDLAFLRIKTASKEAKGVEFTAVNLTASAKGDILDDVVTVARMDEIFNRVPFVATGQINMVTKKPREFLRAGSMPGGCPVFLANGKLLGISAGRFAKGKGPVAVIIPAVDVLEIAEQAKSARPVEEADATSEAPAAKAETENK
jgi:hypothetical protein